MKWMLMALAAAVGLKAGRELYYANQARRSRKRFARRLMDEARADALVIGLRAAEGASAPSQRHHMDWGTGQ
jgi:hypothetical protein